MKQQKTAGFRRAFSLVMAVLMLATYAISASALEPPLNLQPVTGDETVVEQTPEPDTPPAETEDEEETSLPSEPESGEEQDTPDVSLPQQPEEPPVQDSGETVPAQGDQAPTEEPTVGSSGLDPPDLVTFEAGRTSRLLRMARSASGSTTIYMQKLSDFTHTYPFSGGSPYYGYLFYTADGDTAYCIEPARFNSTNGTVVTGSKTYSALSQTQQNAIARAIAANPGGHANPDKYMACQAIIWEIAYNQSPRSGSVYKAVIAANSDKLSSHYESIRSEMQSLGDIPSFMSPDPQNPTEHSMTENGGEWSIDLKNTNGNVTLRESDFQTRAPFDFSVSGDTLTITSSAEPDSDSYTAWHGGSGDGALIFWNSSQQTKASFDETAGIPADGYMVFSSEWTPIDQPPDEGEEEKVGYLQINKYDGENGSPLGGALFKIESEIYVNDSFAVPYGGATVVIPIPEGKDSVEVTVTEVKAPHLYVLDSTPKTVTVTAGDQVNIAQVAFDNYPMSCSLAIYKHEKGNKGMALEGARFRIRYADPDVSAQVWTETTDASGKIHIDLPSSGTLIIEELEAPGGYVIGEISSHEVVVQKGEDKQIDISNDKKAQIIVRKRDNQTGQVLQGAVIKATLLRSHTQPYESGMVYTRTTGPDGTAVFDNMIPGEYRIEETSPPQFYLPTDVVHTVNVYDGSHEPVELEFRNDPWTGLTIKKVDATNGKGLEGAVFKLYEGTAAETTKFLGDFQSNENGVVTITELESDKYYTVVEAQPPYGYFLDEEHNVQTILIKPEVINENITIIFRNMPKPKLLIQKIDADTGLPLTGAVFRVSRRSTAEYVDITTGPDGTYLLENMEEDWYEVYELRSPTGYVTEDTHYDIELIAGETATLTVKNRKKPTLTIEKIDSMTLQPLSGVVFEISLKNGKSLGEFSTDANGRIVLEDAEPGEIYLVKEVRPLPGYLHDETVHELKLDENESGVLKLKNMPQNPLIISKRDAVTGTPIPDTVFRVSHSDGRLVGEYTTGENGMATVTGNDVVPGWYLVQEVRANPAYIASGETKLVELKYEATAMVEFVNQPRTGLQIRKTDAVTGAPIPDVGFYIEEIDGRTIGTYYTDDAGIINLPDQEEIWVQVTEIQAAPGYKPDPTQRTIKLESGKLNILEFRNQPYPTLKIVKLDADTRQPMEGVKIRVYDKFHREVGTFTTNKLGQILLSGVDGGETLYLQEVQTLPGYELDETVHEVTLAWGQTSTVELLNKPLATLRLTKIDSETKAPIYGAVFLLYDAKSNLIGEFVTDQNGVIEFPRELKAGKYKLKEIRCDGYVVDDTVRTIQVKSGETTEIVIENRPMRGQIQIVKKSANDNPVTQDKTGTLLDGAVFEIYNDKLEVVDTITTENGIATSKPLPLGTYGIKETASPDYYLTDGKVFYATLKTADDLVRFEVLNESVDVNVTVEKRGNVEVLAGDVMRYDFSEIRNASNVPLDDFYWHDKLPTDAVRLGKIVTGTWSQRLNYSVEYKTNRKDRWKVLEDGLSSKTSYTLDCGREALDLASNEYVTEIRFHFGTVEPGFCEETGPSIYVTTLADLADGYRIINRTDVGGRLKDEWIVAKDTWITVVWGTQRGDLPKTGI